MATMSDAAERAAREILDAIPHASTDAAEVAKLAAVIRGAKSADLARAVGLLRSASQLIAKRYVNSTTTPDEQAMKYAIDAFLEQHK